MKKRARICEEGGYILRKKGESPQYDPSEPKLAVKRAIETCLRSKVDVTVNLGRNKVLSYRGELSGVYPALFTVRPDDERFLGKTSYSYAEVLCGSVQVKRAE